MPPGNHAPAIGFDTLPAPKEEQGLWDKVMVLSKISRIKLERAREFRKKGAYREAEEELREALEEQPDEPDLKLGLAILYLKQKRYPDAMALAEEVLLDFPSNSQALYVLGEVAFHENRFDAAIGYFKKGYQVDPRPFLKLRIAKTLSKMGKNEEALEVLENELLRDPRNIFYLKEKAVVLNRLGRAGEALAIYKELRELRPHDPFVRKEAIRLAGLEKMTQETIRELEVAINMPSYENDPQLRALLAQKLKEQGSLEAAAHHFLKAFELEPFNPYFVKQAGFCYYKMNNLDEAAMALAQALRLDPDDYYVTSTLDKIHTMRGSLEEYLALIEDILSQHPGKKRLMGKVRSLRKSLEKAQATRG